MPRKSSKTPSKPQSHGIAQLRNRVARLEERLQEWLGREALIVPVSSLGPGLFLVTEPFDVVIQRLDNGEFLAAFSEADIHASGETQQEALAGLKEIVVAKLKLFSRLGEARLGPEPRRQLAILKQHVRKMR